MASVARAPNAPEILARLDSVMASGPYVFGSDWGNLALAQAYESIGNPRDALRALLRRPFDWDTGPLYLSTYLREEGRLRMALGDPAGAVRAYERYLVLREGADATFAATTDTVRRALASIRR